MKRYRLVEQIRLKNRSIYMLPLRNTSPMKIQTQNERMEKTFNEMECQK